VAVLPTIAAFQLNFLRRSDSMFNQLATDANKFPELPLTQAGGPSDPERAKQPPLPEPAYKPYDEKPTLLEPPYKPYAEKPGLHEPLYEPYKDI
jgi:hypothetical protein